MGTTTKAAIVAIALSTLTLLSPQKAHAGSLGDFIFGGILGGVIGGAVGRGPGAVIGTIIGGTAATAIGREARRSRHAGYYWWHGKCYYRYASGEYVRVKRRRCG